MFSTLYSKNFLTSLVGSNILRFTFFFLLLFGTVSAKAQYSDEVVLINGKCELSDPFKKWRFSFDLDARNTFASGVRSKLGGIRVGVEHRRIHRFGIGIYGLNKGINKIDLISIPEPIQNAHFNFSYATLFYERVLYFDKRWEISAAGHLGSGVIETTYQLEDDDVIYTLDPIIVKPIEFSASTYFHPTWWLSTGGGIGYRYMRKTPTELKSDFNGMIYIVKLKLRIGKLLRNCFNPEVKNEF